MYKSTNVPPHCHPIGTKMLKKITDQSEMTATAKVGGGETDFWHQTRC